MVSSVVLLNVDRDRINEVAQELLTITGITEVYSVAGRFDLVAIVRTTNPDSLADVVTGKMLKISGIKGSETLTAFRVFSRHDLDRMFSIGEV